MAGALNGRSATPEIVARLEASFLIDGVDPEDEKQSAIMVDIDNLKRKLLLRHRHQKRT